MSTPWSDRARRLRNLAAEKVARPRLSGDGEQNAPEPDAPHGTSAGADSLIERAPATGGLPDDLTLTGEEALALALLEYLMVHRDVANDASTDGVPDAKGDVRDKLADQVVGVAKSSLPLNSWHYDLLRALTEARDPADERDALVSAAAEAAASLHRRIGAMLVLVELHLFDPWPQGRRWSRSTQQKLIAEVAGWAPSLATEDNGRVEKELRSALRKLGRKQVRWGRVAVVGVAGLGLGAVTGGMAAPLVGASIGAASGLSGAAATSFGLAALGGGSLAAGGFGIAGGTAVLTGLGAFAGAGVAAGGARATRWAKPGEVAREALRTAVVTRLVTLDQEHDEEKAKRIVLALQARLDEVSSTIAYLGTRIRELTDENIELRAKLRTERDESMIAKRTLQIAIDCIDLRRDVDQDYADVKDTDEHGFDVDDPATAASPEQDDDEQDEPGR